MSRAVIGMALLALGSSGCSLRSECEVNPQLCPLVVELQGSPELDQNHPDYFLPLRITGRLADQPLTFSLTQAETTVDVSMDTVAGDDNLYIVQLSPASTQPFQPGWIGLIVTQEDTQEETRSASVVLRLTDRLPMVSALRCLFQEPTMKMGTFPSPLHPAKPAGASPHRALLARIFIAQGAANGGIWSIL